MDITSLSQPFSYSLHFSVGYIKDVCQLSSSLGFKTGDDQDRRLWLKLWHVVRDQVALQIRSIVLGLFLCIPWNVLMMLFDTGNTQICDSLNCFRYFCHWEEKKTLLALPSCGHQDRFCRQLSIKWGRTVKFTARIH